jgi:type I restriction enzyme, S subunit
MRFEVAGPTDWHRARWGDLVELAYGKALGKRKQAGGPAAVFGTNGPTGDAASESQGPGPTIVIGRKGAYRGVTWAPGPFWIIDTAFFVVPKAELDLEWAFRALTTEDINALDSGSAIPSTRREDVYQLSVLVPTLDEQRRIAGVLRALDDKIENNRRLAKTLGEIAAALFNAKFVDFDGRDDLVESEIGPIPRGWRVVALSKAVEINPSVRTIRKGTVVPHVGMADVPAWGVRPGRVANREYSGGARFEPGDTLMARITGCIEHGKGAFVDFLDGPGTGSTEFLVFRARPPLTPEMVFLLSRTPRVRDYAIANMSGSSGRQRVQAAALDHIAVAVPPSVKAVEREASLFRSIFGQTRALWRESQTLEQLRDALLPRLISGQLRVPHNAALSSEAV